MALILATIAILILALAAVTTTANNPATTTSALKLVLEWKSVQSHPQLPSLHSTVQQMVDKDERTMGGKCTPNGVVYKYPAGPKGKKWVFIQGYSGGGDGAVCPAHPMFEIWTKAISDNNENNFTMVGAETFKLADFEACLDGDQLKCLAEKEGCGIQCTDGVSCKGNGQCGGWCDQSRVNNHGHIESLCVSGGLRVGAGLVAAAVVMVGLVMVF